MFMLYYSQVHFELLIFTAHFFILAQLHIAHGSGSKSAFLFLWHQYFLSCNNTSLVILLSVSTLAPYL